jgi:GT2 family glycosyltransferase
LPRAELLLRAIPALLKGAFRLAPRLWIVLVNYNGLEDTRKCLRSIAGLVGGPVPTVVVDNASTDDPSVTLQREFSWCDVVRTPTNSGWAGGNNTGIIHALGRGADLVVLLNNDTTVTQDFSERLLAASVAHPTFGILGPVINFMDDPDEVMTDGCAFHSSGLPGFFQRQPVPLSRAEAPAIMDVDIVNGCCMMIGRQVFERIGLIDERFFLIHEETDFCLRARRAGFRCGVFGESLVWHKGSSSFKRSGKRWQRYYDARNLSLLLRKYRATHRPACGAWRSRIEYLKYVYSRYAVERQEGHPDAADAVLEGLCDALLGRYGPYVSGQARALPVFRTVFEFCRRWR